MPAVRLDQAEREQQIDLLSQAIRCHAPAPHRKSVASALQEFELIGVQGSHAQGYRPATRALRAKSAVSGRLAVLQRPNRSAGIAPGSLI
jgi:hypothetical protein